jgi:hypothetical protein
MRFTMNDPQKFRTVFDYPPGYLGPRPLAQQISEIAWRYGLCARLALAYIERGLPKKLPGGAEGWFAIPTVASIVAKLEPNMIDPVERYRLAARHACRVLGVAQDFDSRLAEKQIFPWLSRDERSACALELIAQEQPGDILIIAAQLGELHRAVAARDIAFEEREYGLGTLEAAAILLTHPERLVRLEDIGLDLCLDMPGDVCPRSVDGQLHAPAFDQSGIGISYGTNWYGSACDRTGQATAFLPKHLKLEA